MEEAGETIGSRELNLWMAHWNHNGPFDGSRVDPYLAQIAATSVLPHVKDPQKVKRTDYLIWGKPESRNKDMTDEEIKLFFRSKRNK